MRCSVGAVLLLVLSAVPAYADGLVFLGLQRDGVGGVDGLYGVWGIALSPDGAHVYVTGSFERAVAVFQRDLATGTLAFVQVLRDSVAGVDGLGGARGIAVSPDGAHVYVAGTSDNAVAVFQRNLASGALAFVEAQKDGIAGVDGLGFALRLALSPDGAHVYVAGFDDNAVAVFQRNPATGALGFVQALKDGIGGIDGLAGASSIALSPDGAHVYVTGEFDDAVAVFQRSAVSGALAFVQAQKDGIAGVDGLDSAAGIALSPDGAHVYVTGEFDDAVAVFQRNPATGTLAFVQAQKDGIAGVDGLDGAVAIAPSPDGAHVYVAGSQEGAVAAFRQITCGDGHRDGAEQCDDGNRVAGDCCAAACQLEAAGTACADDGNACTADVCDAAGGCGHAATAGAPCADDGSLCTADLCDAAGACAHVAAPAPDCHVAAPRRGRLALADRRGPRDRLAWRWAGTLPGGAAAWGDPLATTGYGFCLYTVDGAGGVALHVDAAVPPGGRCGRRACWRRVRAGFAYQDVAGRQAGVEALRLGARRITLAGGGARLGLPPLPIGDGEQVIAQLRSDGGACVGTTFARAQRRTKRLYRARTD